MTESDDGGQIYEAWIEGDAFDRVLPEVGPDLVLRRHADAAWVIIDDEVVVYLLRLETSWVLDRTAALLWQVLDGDAPLDEIVADFADAFSVPAAQIFEDFRAVLAEWLFDGLVEEVSRG